MSIELKIKRQKSLISDARRTQGLIATPLPAADRETIMAHRGPHIKRQQERVLAAQREIDSLKRQQTAGRIVRIIRNTHK